MRVTKGCTTTLVGRDILPWSTREWESAGNFRLVRGEGVAQQAAAFERQWQSDPREDAGDV